jgi:hypothetical protein
MSSNLTLLKKVISLQSAMLSTSPTAPDFSQFSSIRSTVTQINTSIGSMASTESLLSREISFGRFNGRDMKKLLGCLRTLASRATNFVIFYEIVETHMSVEERQKREGVEKLTVRVARHDRFDSSATSEQASPLGTPSRLQSVQQSRNDSPERNGARSRSLPRINGMSSRSGINTPETSRGRHGKRHSLNEEHRIDLINKTKLRLKQFKTIDSHSSIPALLHEILAPLAAQKPVGLLESQRYMYLEDSLANKWVKSIFLSK